MKRLVINLISAASRRLRILNRPEGEKVAPVNVVHSVYDVYHPDGVTCEAKSWLKATSPPRWKCTCWDWTNRFTRRPIWAVRQKETQGLLWADACSICSIGLFTLGFDRSGLNVAALCSDAHFRKWWFQINSGGLFYRLICNQGGLCAVNTSLQSLFHVRWSSDIYYLKTLNTSNWKQTLWILSSLSVAAWWSFQDCLLLVLFFKLHMSHFEEWSQQTQLYFVT